MANGSGGRRGGGSPGRGGNTSGTNSGSHGGAGDALRGRSQSKERDDRQLLYGDKKPKNKVEKPKAKTLLWEFKQAQTSFVEGHEAELRYGEPGGSEQISQSEFDKRTKAYNAQQTKWGNEMTARGKIKPISDPDATVTDSRKRAVRRKNKGRTGTLLSQGSLRTGQRNSETLG